MSKYTLTIWKEGVFLKKIHASFKDEDEMREAVENYIDEQTDVVVEVLKNQKIVHKYSMEIGSHNQIKLYDQI